MNNMKLVPTIPTDAMLDRAVAFALNVQLGGEYGWTQYMRDLWARFIDGAALAPTDAAGAPIYQIQMLDEAWGDVTKAQYEHLDVERKRIVYAAPVAPAAVAPPFGSGLVPLKVYSATSSALAQLHEICLRHGCGNEVMHDWLERTLASTASVATDAAPSEGVSADSESAYKAWRDGLAACPALLFDVWDAGWNAARAAPPTVAADAVAPICMCSGLGPCEQRTDGSCRLKAQPCGVCEGDCGAEASGYACAVQWPNPVAWRDKHETSDLYARMPNPEQVDAEALYTAGQVREMLARASQGESNE